jgi:hypothetical protein
VDDGTCKLAFQIPRNGRRGQLSIDRAVLSGLFLLKYFKHETGCSCSEPSSLSTNSTSPYSLLYTLRSRVSYLHPPPNPLGLFVKLYSSQTLLEPHQHHISHHRPAPQNGSVLKRPAQAVFALHLAVDDHVLHLRPHLRAHAPHGHDPLGSRPGGC